MIECVDGDLLSDLIEAGQDTAGVWRMVGAAYRRVHAVGFPAGLAGEELAPDRFVLKPVDPVERLHQQIDDARPGLRQLLPDHVVHLPAVHEVVQNAAAAPAVFGHGDINMWNVLITPEQAVLIDWDYPRVADPAMEIALLDKHASLFNKTDLPDAFFTGYGQVPVEPNTSPHRLVQTLEWATSSDWAEFEADPVLPIKLVTLNGADTCGWRRTREPHSLDPVPGTSPALQGHASFMTAVSRKRLLFDTPPVHYRST